MEKRFYKIVSGICFVISIFFIADSEINLSGAFIGTNILFSFSSFLGALFLIFFGILLVEGTAETLEEKVKSHWKRYSMNPNSILEDIEQRYLSSIENKEQRTSLQERIEHAVTGGKLIDGQTGNKKSTYKEQFYEGHAALGGRIIDVESHIAKSGKNKGKLIHFGQPANAKYLWIIDENGNFIVANRQTMLHDMPKMHPEKIDYSHRLHKLPHATLARGKRVYGSGEVIVEGGVVKSFNTASGHYVDIKDIASFNKQGEEVFRYFVKKLGWKEVEGCAKYEIKKYS